MWVALSHTRERNAGASTAKAWATKHRAVKRDKSVDIAPQNTTKRIAHRDQPPDVLIATRTTLRVPESVKKPQAQIPVYNEPTTNATVEHCQIQGTNGSLDK
jgi:hypothetical protein